MESDASMPMLTNIEDHIFSAESGSVAQTLLQPGESSHAKHVLHEVGIKLPFAFAFAFGSRASEVGIEILCLQLDDEATDSQVDGVTRLRVLGPVPKTCG